jgi:hypothetical protein
MGKKGIRSAKGQPESDWGEPKTDRVNLGLTSTGKRLAGERADRLGVSLSEIFERWARGISVDQDDAIVAPTDSIPSVETILKSLPRLSRLQLTRIAWTVLTLLLGKPLGVEAALIMEQIKSADAEELGAKAGIPPERISEIQKGGDIYNDELIKLARVFGHSTVRTKKPSNSSSD